MKLIPCPLSGLRPQNEFHYGGVYHPMPDPATLDDKAWAEHLFHRDGAPGVVREWWYHLPSGLWFIAERDTATDAFIRSYLYSELKDHE